MQTRMTSRNERMEYAEALLEAALKKAGKVKIWEFVAALQEKRHLGITHSTARSYWEALKANPKFEHDSFEITLKR